MEVNEREREYKMKMQDNNESRNYKVKGRRRESFPFLMTLPPLLLSYAELIKNLSFRFCLRQYWD